MTLKLFCDGCEKRIRAGQSYNTVRYEKMSDGWPMQGGDFHLHCWDPNETVVVAPSTTKSGDRLIIEKRVAG